MLPKKLHPNTPQPRWTFRLPMTIDPQKWNIILHYRYIDILKHICLLHKQQLWYTINPVKIQSKNKDSRNIPMHTCAKKCVSLHNLNNEITASLITHRLNWLFAVQHTRIHHFGFNIRCSNPNQFVFKNNDYH